MSKTKELLNENTETILKDIFESANKVDLRSSKKLDNNYSLKLSISEFQNDFLNNGQIKTISINNELNTISLNLYNGFVLSVMSKVYNADFGYIKTQLKNTSQMVVFNKMVNSEITKNKNIFLESL